MSAAITVFHIAIFDQSSDLESDNTGTTRLGNNVANLSSGVGSKDG